MASQLGLPEGCQQVLTDGHAAFESLDALVPGKLGWDPSAFSHKTHQHVTGLFLDVGHYYYYS